MNKPVTLYGDRLVFHLLKSKPIYCMVKAKLRFCCRGQLEVAIFIGVTQKGDRVIGVTSELVAIQRKSGEVDIIPLLRDEMGLRVDTEGIVTIGYGNNTVQTTVDDIASINFYNNEM